MKEKLVKVWDSDLSRAGICKYCLSIMPKRTLIKVAKYNSGTEHFPAYKYKYFHRDCWELSPDSKMPLFPEEG